MRTYHKDRNIWIANADGTGEKALTTDGSEEKRINSYGTASWVYGEELGQTSAIWWSPDSTKVAFYRFDDSKVKDFYLQMTQTDIQSSLDIGDPKAYAPNPVADIFIYDTKAWTTTKVDVRDGRPFTDIPADGTAFANDNVGHYVSDQLVAGRQRTADEPHQSPAEQAGVCRVCACVGRSAVLILSEEWPTGWVVNSPPIQY